MRQLISFRKDAEQLGVVVQHLLKVGDGPGGLGAVSVETAAEMIVKAAEGHGVEGADQGFAYFRAVAGPILAQQ